MMRELIIQVISTAVGVTAGLAAMIFTVKILSKNKSKWGINLNRVDCPVCGARQPFVRMPDSFSQAMWGGTTCPKCHTHLDKWGEVIVGK